MRRLFHEHQCLDKIDNKQLRPVLLKERHCDPTKSGQIFCTYSQIISLQDTQLNEIVRVHQYKKPDGTIGGSGMPDPIRMFLEGIVYKLEPKREN
jgi:hypothetical protein